MPPGAVTDRNLRLRRRVLPCLALCGTLVAAGLPAAAQTAAGAGDRPLLHEAQFMPGMPAMPQMTQMPGMMAPMQGGSQGSMGGGMAMVMTGDTLGEMMAGACAAGLFIGGVAAVAATAPAAPISASVVANSAVVGCGFAAAATAAGMAGMLGWRAAYHYFQ